MLHTISSSVAWNLHSPPPPRKGVNLAWGFSILTLRQFFLPPTKIGPFWGGARLKCSNFAWQEFYGHLDFSESFDLQQMGESNRLALTPSLHNFCSLLRLLAPLEIVYFKKKTTEGLDKVQGSIDPRFAAGLPFPVPEILELESLSQRKTRGEGKLRLKGGEKTPTPRLQPYQENGPFY